MATRATATALTANRTEDVILSATVATIRVLARAELIAPDRTADALLACMRSKLVPFARADAAMKALDLDKFDLARARQRADTVTDMPSTKPHAQPRPQGRIANLYRPERVVPQPRQPERKPTVVRPVTEDGELRCTLCGEWKPAEAFMLRSDRIGSGTRRSACTPCHDRRNKSRYLNVVAKEALNAVGLSFTIGEGDDAASLSCAKCGQKLEVGQDVTTGDTTLSHTVCPGGSRA